MSAEGEGMSLQEDGESFMWSCDRCHRRIEAQGDGFYACWEFVKRRGWVAAKEDGVWYHTCRVCRAPSKAKDLMSRVRPAPPVAPPSIFGGSIVPAIVEEIWPLRERRVFTGRITKDFFK